jgi:ubiquinone biosynthesis accessory factor UbiJ
MLLRERGERGLAGLDPAASRVQVSGDAELARTLSRLVERFEPDLERAFGGVVGEVAGVQLARALERGLDWARESAASLAEDAGAFVRDESRDAVARDELDGFLADVDRLRDDAERLAARVARLRPGSDAVPRARADAEAAPVARPRGGAKR